MSENAMRYGQEKDNNNESEILIGNSQAATQDCVLS